MNIIVCIKQVPKTTNVKIDLKTGRIIREGIPSIINPDDKNAMEEAIKIKELIPSKITVITMGPPQAEEALREAIAMGADEGILLSDIMFAGSDSWSTSNVLASAIKKIGAYDLILCGRQAIDGDTAQVPPELAESLGIPQITYAQKIEILSGKVKVEKETEEGYNIVEAPLPVLITCNSNINNPRYPTLIGLNNAFEKDLIRWNAKDLNISKEDVESLTYVKKTFKPAAKGKGTMLKGSMQEMANELAKILKK
ncbi:MAG: electron transfer flavoprotein subunit beta/FixA family protein [Nanoarchaeota archaeon]